MESLKKRAAGLLRRSERLFKLDVIYLVKGGLWTSLRFGTSILASFATMIAFGNFLPKETYGIYSYLISLASSVGFLTLSGIGPGIVRAIATGEERVMQYAMRLQLSYNFMAVIAIMIAAFYYGVKGNFIFAVSLAFLALALPLSEAFHAYEHVLIGKKRFDTLAIIASLSTIGSAFATVTTLLITDNVVILISVFSTMSLGPNIIAYYLVKKRLPKGAPAPEAKQELKRTAFHITGAGIIGTVANYLDKIILFQVAGPAPLAVYGFAVAGPERLKGLIKNWMSIILPRLAERDAKEIHAMFYKRLGLSMLMGGALALSYILLSPYLFRWFLPKYLDSILYSQVYALGLIVIPVLVYIGNIFYSQNMLRAIYTSSTGIQILRIVLLLILGWRWQAWGLVAAWLITQVLSVIYCIYIWEKEYEKVR